MLRRVYTYRYQRMAILRRARLPRSARHVLMLIAALGADHAALAVGHTTHTAAEQEDTRMHPEDVPVLVHFSTSAGSAQVTLSGLAPRAQYTVGLEMSEYTGGLDAMSVASTRPVFQAFRTISVPPIGQCEALGTRALDSSCILPHNKTDTVSHAQHDGADTRLMPNGDVILRYDLLAHDKEARQFTVLVTDTFRNSLVTYSHLPLLLQYIAEDCCCLHMHAAANAYTHTHTHTYA